MLALVFAAATLIAQATPEPTPTPDPMIYDDPAMHFHAPTGFLPVGQRHIPVSALGDDPVTVAGWIFPNKDHPRKILIQLESFQGTSVEDFEGSFEEQLRGQLDSPFFKQKEHVSLKNGMPAMMVEVSSGSGFDLQKSYILEWADGQRGVAIVVSSSVDDLDMNKAKALLLSDVSAVAYPMGRDEP